jgi:hypothetical protein
MAMEGGTYGAACLFFKVRLERKRLEDKQVTRLLRLR